MQSLVLQRATELTKARSRRATRCGSIPTTAWPSNSWRRPQERGLLPRHRARAAVGKSRRPGRGAAGDPGRHRAAAAARGVVREIPAHHAQGLSPLRPARLRQDADRQGHRLQSDRTSSRSRPGRRCASISCTSRGRKSSTCGSARASAWCARSSPPRARSARKASCPSSSSTRRRASSARAAPRAISNILSHARADVLHGDGWHRVAQRRRHHPRLEPRGYDRPGHPPPRPHRPQNQGQPPDQGRRARDLQNLSHARSALRSRAGAGSRRRAAGHRHARRKDHRSAIRPARGKQVPRSHPAQRQARRRSIAAI